MNEKYMPQSDDEKYAEYFEDKYGEGAVGADKSNRKANQISEKKRIPVSGRSVFVIEQAKRKRFENKYGGK